MQKLMQRSCLRDLDRLLPPATWLSVLALWVAEPSLALAAPGEAAAEAAPAVTSSAADSEESASGDVDQLQVARLHFSNGVELLQEEPPNYQDAYWQFLLAYEKSGGNWKVLGNLGLTAMKLERDGEALHYYAEYLEKGGDEIDPSEREHIEKERLLINGNMGQVKLSSNESDAKIFVKRQGSSVPTQAYELHGGAAELGLRSGSLVVTAKTPKEELKWEIVLSPGQSVEHDFEFGKKAVASAPVAAAAPAPAATRRGLGGAQVAGIATAGVGLVAVGVGAALGVVSQSQEDDARALCIGDVCPSSAESDFDQAKSSATLATALMIGGGVLAATGLSLVIVGGSKSKPQSAELDTGRGAHRRASQVSLRLTPVLSPFSGGLAASGTF